MNINSLLKQIDCTDYEARTFLTLFEEINGAAVLVLSKKLNLPRATIYGHLSSLIAKGLVKKARGERGTIFFVENIENILSIYNEKIIKIKNAQSNLEKLIKSRDVATSYQPKFIIYDTKDAAKSIFRDILRSRESQTYWFWPMKEMLKVIQPEIFKHFNTERVKRNISSNILWPPKRKINIKNHPLLGPWDEEKSLRKIKILPENIDQTMGYAIYGNKVAFISSNRENYGFIVDSRELAQSLKAQFDYFWKISKDYRLK